MTVYGRLFIAYDEYREDNRRKVKKADGGLPVSLWDTYSSFANCYGGVIILGVKENKDVIIVIYVLMAKREQKPVYINNDIFNGTFRRNYEGDYHCTRL